jgi:heat shock protein HslJ
MGLIAMLPVHDAFADRARRPAQGKARNTAPAAALSLAGTYALTTVGMRPVRDEELAKSKITFASNGSVSIQTACNRMGASLQTRSKPGEILGFSNPLQTLLPCQGRVDQAETTTRRLIVETTNIARAGNRLTFFNINGANIAQWTLVAPSAAAAVSAPQRGAPAPIRADFGDYILTELGGSPVLSYPARPAQPPAGTPKVPEGAPEAAPVTPPPNARLVTNVPTLFLRANGSVMGSGGCNNYSASLVETREGARRFGPVGATKKACLDRGTRALESQFFTTLRNTNRVEIGPRRVDLYARNGTRTARFAAVGARADRGPSLYGTTWILRSLNGEPIARTAPPSITFDGNQASGSTGCNRYSIQHNRQNGRSRFSNNVSTRMACVDNARHVLEGRYIAALLTVTTIEVSATTLTLRAADLQTVLVFDAE